MLRLIIGILITIVLGAILFWVIDKFCPEARLAQLLKLLVVLFCLGGDRSPTASIALLSISSLGAPIACATYLGPAWTALEDTLDLNGIG